MFSARNKCKLYGCICKKLSGDENRSSLIPDLMALLQVTVNSLLCPDEWITSTHSHAYKSTSASFPITKMLARREREKNHRTSTPNDFEDDTQMRINLCSSFITDVLIMPSTGRLWCHNLCPSPLSSVCSRHTLIHTHLLLFIVNSPLWIAFTGRLYWLPSHYNACFLIKRNLPQHFGPDPMWSRELDARDFEHKCVVRKG